MSIFLFAAQPAPTADGRTNPLLREWDTPFGVPPFAEIQEAHFLPAIEQEMGRQKDEIAKIAESAESPDFANTIEALEQSGSGLDRVSSVFGVLSGAETNEKLQEIARLLAPLQAAHRDWISLHEKLFRRVKAVWDQRASLKLTREQQLLLERTYKRFVRGGALLDGEKKVRLQEINSELASLGVKFGDNLLKEMNGYRLVVEDRARLRGLPESLVADATQTARKAGLESKWAFTLHAPSLWPFLQYAQDRDLRRQIFNAYTSRGRHGDETDNRGIAARSAALRTEKARLLGYDTWADYVLEENMAKTPGSVYELLNRLWTPAKAVAAREAAQLRKVIRSEGNDFELEPWDWFYCAEKVRQAEYQLDEDALRPYFRLENVRDGAFWVANKLYGISFTEWKDLPGYSSELTAFDVKDADGTHLAVFYVDFHPRPGKRSGAWCTRLRSTWIDGGKSVRPIVLNVCNFSRGSQETPALLTLEEVETLFHEFGHALHSILSRVTYRSLGGTPTDFVELPSQIMENWAFEPEVMNRYARHWKTGEVIPPALVEKIRSADRFNQGFKTVEYLAASLLDLEWHTLANTVAPDADVLERMALARMGLPRQIVPRYRSSYFQHIFAGGYSSGYYSYIWAEVLDADAFQAFKENGIFDAATARSFRTNILEKGYSEEPMTQYQRFRGRGPEVEPLLDRRGLRP